MESLAGLQGKAATHAAAKKAEGLLAPLLEVDEEDDERSWASTSTSGAISVEVKRTPAQKLQMSLGEWYSITSLGRRLSRNHTR